MEPELLHPPSPGSFVWFSLICSRGGGSTAAAVTLDTVADESRKMADSVARSSSRLGSRDRKIACYGDALSTIFMLACICDMLPTFRFSFFLFFSCISVCFFIFLVSFYLSVQKPFDTLSKYVFYSTCSFCLFHLHPTPSLNSLFFVSLVFFFVARISRVTFFCCAHVPGTLELHLPTLIL